MNRELWFHPEIEGKTKKKKRVIVKHCCSTIYNLHRSYRNSLSNIKVHTDSDEI